MKRLTFTILSILIFGTSYAQKENKDFITDDIDNFWIAYDQITKTKDSIQQYNLLNTLFIEKGTPGLKALMDLKRYTSKSYINAINSYPLFWNSIRPNVLKAKGLAKEIETEIDKFKVIYPDYKPAKLYFTIGAFQTGGTIFKDMVLIGSEISLADQHTNTSEFPQQYNHLKTFFKENPISNVAFTNIHEYIHTQQKTTVGNTLLAQTILEGVAEFIAEIATGKKSTLPALAYGKANNDRIRKVFSNDMFKTNTGFWLYSNQENEFNIRDLGYYVGYAICEKYYNRTTDKKLAIKEMIELNYNNEEDLKRFVDKSKYFEKPTKTIELQFENSRPTVTGITEFKNKSNNVSSNHKQITINFSAPMSKTNTNFKYGPLGEKALLRVKSLKGFSDDGKSVTLEIELKPNQLYQIEVGSGFRSKDLFPLKPYLIEFKTSDK